MNSRRRLIWAAYRVVHPQRLTTTTMHADAPVQRIVASSPVMTGPVPQAAGPARASRGPQRPRRINRFSQTIRAQWTSAFPFR